MTPTFSLVIIDGREFLREDRRMTIPDPMKYFRVDGAGARRPDRNALADAVEDFQKHCASLRQFPCLEPWTGRKQGLVEGVDFRVESFDTSGDSCKAYPFVQVAVPIQIKKEETQDELWDEVIEMLKGRDSKGMSHTMAEVIVIKLSKHFIIKRK